MEFYKQLREYALIPSPSRNEGMMAKVLAKRFSNITDEGYRDSYGNLYFIRRGEKEGRLMLCAHQDKVLQSNRIGRVEKNSNGAYHPILDRFNQETLSRLLNWPIHVMDYNEVIQVEAKRLDQSSKIRAKIIERKFSREEDREFFEDLDSEVIKFNEYELQNIEVRPYKDIGKNSKILIAGPNFYQDRKIVRGKLDDALGLALIDDVFHKTTPSETPDLLAVFTTCEEIGSYGAEHAVKELKKFSPLDEIIILDTTAMIKPGEGFALYENCGSLDLGSNYDFFNENFLSNKGTKKDKEPLVEKIEREAKEQGFRMHTVPAFFNDARVFASQTKIPTVALEPPILGMHSSEETGLKTDIEELKRFLHHYVRNFQPL